MKARVSRWLAVLACLVVAPGAAHAEPGEGFVVPRDPRASPPRWVLAVHFDGVLAADVDGLCPAGVRCVYEGGGGVGATAEHRWPWGLGVFGEYDAWFIDSNSVFELGVQQGLSLGVRYTAPNAAWVHPVVDFSVGASLFGDTFRVDSPGLMLTGTLGVQFELSRYFGVLGALGVRAFSHGPFTTERDGAARGAGEAFSEALFLRIALTIDGRPWAAAEP